MRLFLSLAGLAVVALTVATRTTSASSRAPAAITARLVARSNGTVVR